MKLNQSTDYALRVLMYCAAHERREQAPTIAEIAQAHDISRSHLMKVVMKLSALGWLATTRGRGGGLRLLRPADQVIIGQVVRQMEEDFTMVECFKPQQSNCRIQGSCRLQGALAQALASYLQVLDGMTLAQMVTEPAKASGIRWVASAPINRSR